MRYVVIFSFTMLSVMAFGCSKHKKAETADTDSTTDSVTDSASDSVTDSVTHSNPADTETNTASDVDTGSDTDSDPGIPAADGVAAMKIGYALGNSLDVPDGETAWGNPAVSAAFVQGLADAGFGAVRIPVSWSPHLGSAPDYTIDPDWLNRVAEVVKYVTDAGMYAIINMHHDGSDGYSPVEWITLYSTEEKNAEVRQQFAAVWSQIATHFRTVDSHLIFESMNEIHDGEKSPSAAQYDAVNQLNQTFVDAVRKSGGKNRTRLLSIPGYYAKIDYTVAGLTLPTDTAANRLIVTVHQYSPIEFTYLGTTHTWGAASPGSNTSGQEDFIIEQFDLLKTTFIDKGIPVMLSEFGAVDQEGYGDYRRYYLEYVIKAAHDRGITPIVWDNGNMGSGEDAFGLIDRRSAQAESPALLEAIMRAVNDPYAIGDIAPPEASEIDTEIDTEPVLVGGILTWKNVDGNQFGLYLPDDWDGANLPVMMFLHGYTGNPLNVRPAIIDAVNDVEPCAVFLPYRPSSEGASAWGGTYDDTLRTAMVTTLAELDRIIAQYGLNTSRQYLYGESMGGEGVYKLLATYPERFAAGVVASGYTVVSGADAMAQTPLWIFHGSADTTADVANARDIYQAILDAGGELVTYTEYEDYEHVPAITRASTEPGLPEWILGQTRQ